MAIRRVCDRCGKEVSIGLISKNLIKKGIIDKYYDLCPACLVEFDKWMKGKEENNDSAAWCNVKSDIRRGCQYLDESTLRCSNHDKCFGKSDHPTTEVGLRDKYGNDINKNLRGNTYEPKTENEENETGAGVV